MINTFSIIKMGFTRKWRSFCEQE